MNSKRHDALLRSVERLNRQKPTILVAPPAVLTFLSEEKERGRLDIAPVKVIRPDWNGVKPKPSCSISGIRNGTAPIEMRNSVPPTAAARKALSENCLRSRMGLG